MLIDSLLFNQPDRIYFEMKIDLAEIASEKLIEDEETGIWLAGPGKFELNKSNLPLALVWKTSNKLNVGSSPRKNGHLILSHHQSKEVSVKKLFPSGKQPAAVKNPEPTTGPKSEKERFSVGQTWYEQDRKIFSNHSGNWSAAVIAGSTISNIVEFEVHENTSATAHKKLQGPMPRLSVSTRSLFTRTTEHPEPPRLGVTSKLGRSLDGKNVYCLYGSFSFPISSLDEKIISLTALISGSEYLEMPFWSIDIPLEYTRIEDGIRKGQFIVDMERKLGNPKVSTFKFPIGTHITFVYRSWIGKPIFLDPSEIGN